MEFTVSNRSTNQLSLPGILNCDFSLQLWSIYAAGNTVPIPFLRATDISPIALLSDNVIGGAHKDSDGGITTEALQELFTSDGQNKKGRRQQNEVTKSFLAHVLANTVRGGNYYFFLA